MQLGWAGKEWMPEDRPGYPRGPGGAVVASYHTNLPTYATLFGFPWAEPVSKPESSFDMQKLLYSVLVLTRSCGVWFVGYMESEYGALSRPQIGTYLFICPISIQMPAHCVPFSINSGYASLTRYTQCSNLASGCRLGTVWATSSQSHTPSILGGRNSPSKFRGGGGG